MNAVLRRLWNARNELAVVQEATPSGTGTHYSLGRMIAELDALIAKLEPFLET